MQEGKANDIVELIMLTTLLILSMLIWLPLLFHQIANRGFLILLIWLLIAPVALNVIKRPGQNPLFSPPQEYDIEYLLQNPRLKEKASLDRYLARQTTITLKDLIEPTRTLFVLFLAVFLLNATLKKERLAAFDKTEIRMVVFSLILVTSALLQSVRLTNSLRVASDAFIVPFLAYYITRRLVTSENRLRQLTLVMGYTSLYIIICALIERLLHPWLFYRISGPLGSDNQLYIIIMAAFFMILLPLNGGNRFLEEKTTVPPGVRWFVICLVPVTVFATWARSNWLGFLSGIWIVLFLGHRLLQLPRKLAMMGIILLLIPMIVLSAISFIPKEIIEERVAQEHTIYSRLGAWVALMQEGFKRPIFGNGFNNAHFLLLQQETMFEGVRGERSSAHNGFLTIFAELGIVGLLAYLAIIVSIIQTGLSLYRRGLHPQDRWRGIGVIALLVAHLVPALTTTIMHLPSVSHVYVFACIGGIVGLYSHSQRLAVTAPHGARYPILVKGPMNTL